VLSAVYAYYLVQCIRTHIVSTRTHWHTH